MQHRFLTFGLIVLLLSCGWAAAQSTTTRTYRWVDDNGVTHFSDSPRPGSQDPSKYEYEIRTPKASRSSSQPTPSAKDKTNDSSDDDANAVPPFAGYQQMRISAPRDGETLWNIGGTLNVGVQLSPGLAQGHGIVIIMDGRVMTPQPVRGTSVTLTGVYRGVHTLVAAVRSPSGQEHIASQPVRFVVQQSTVN